MGEEILVTTEYLKEKGEEWAELLKLAQKAYQEAADCAERLEQFFCCRESETLRGKYLREKEEGLKDFGALSDHLEKLKSMALIYEEAERSNVNATA